MTLGAAARRCAGATNDHKGNATRSDCVWAQCTDLGIGGRRAGCRYKRSSSRDVVELLAVTRENPCMS